MALSLDGKEELIIANIRYTFCRYDETQYVVFKRTDRALYQTKNKDRNNTAYL